MLTIEKYKTMKQILILILILTLVSCKQETSNQFIDEPTEEQETGIQEVMSTITYQIDFDEVEYYSNDTLKDKTIYYDIFKKKKKNDLDELLIKTATSNYPLSLNNTSFLSEIQKIGYKKMNFPKAKNGLLKEYFAKEHNTFETACEPIYRDIIVLKKNNRRTHLFKICFSCAKTIKVTKTKNEGMYLSDYRHLEKLLKGEIEN